MPAAFFASRSTITARRSLPRTFSDAGFSTALRAFPGPGFRVLLKPGLNIRRAVEYPAPDIHAGKIVQAVKRSGANADVSGSTLAGQYCGGYLIVHCHFSYAVIILFRSRYKKIISGSLLFL
jgi:hypothetical protein